VIAFMLAEQVAKALDTVFGQGLHSMLFDAVNPDNAVFGASLHLRPDKAAMGLIH